MQKPNSFQARPEITWGTKSSQPGSQTSFDAVTRPGTSKAAAAERSTAIATSIALYGPQETNDVVLRKTGERVTQHNRRSSRRVRQQIDSRRKHTAFGYEPCSVREQRNIIRSNKVYVRNNGVCIRQIAMVANAAGRTRRRRRRRRRQKRGGGGRRRYRRWITTILVELIHRAEIKGSAVTEEFVLNNCECRWRRRVGAKGMRRRTGAKDEIKGFYS